MNTADTIVALASAPPPAPRVVIRLSGPAAFPAAQSLTHTELHPGPLETHIHLSGVTSQLRIPIVAWVFKSPRSYTGEDTVELHLPGSPWIVTQAMHHLLAQPGVRMATAGEFTARAYLAGKMDLTAAEGVALAVSAADELQLKAARQLLAGTLAGKVRDLSESLATLLALLEAGIDFTDEDVSFVSETDLKSGISNLKSQITSILTAGAKFNARGLTPTVVLVGRPNAGKSSLFNALLGHHRVVVSPIAGTTRDAIYADLQLPRGPAQLVDIAGLEDPPPVTPGSEGARCAPPLAHAHPTTDNPIATAMQSRAQQTLANADVLLEVIDGTTHDRIPPTALPRTPDLAVYTKSDLPTFNAPLNSLSFSTTTLTGLPALRSALDTLLFSHEGGQALALNSRHTAHLEAALASLSAAEDVIGQGDEIVAASLRAALDALGEITGVISPDDVLGKVFSTFCIGK